MATNITLIEEIFSQDFVSKPYTFQPKVKPTLQSIVDVIFKNDDIGPWIAGGCGRQLAIGENTFNDIDVWFRHAYQFEQTRERLHNAFGREMYETYASGNATTYQVGDYKVQLIRRAYYASIDEVFKNFDFTCCQVAVDKNLNIYGPGIDDARNCVLKLCHFDGRAFLARYAKYVGYGYKMDPDEFIQILERPEINYEFDSEVFGY